MKLIFPPKKRGEQKLVNGSETVTSNPLKKHRDMLQRPKARATRFILPLAGHARVAVAVAVVVEEENQRGLIHPEGSYNSWQKGKTKTKRTKYQT